MLNVLKLIFLSHCFVSVTSNEDNGMGGSEGRQLNSTFGEGEDLADAPNCSHFPSSHEVKTPCVEVTFNEYTFQCDQIMIGKHNLVFGEGFYSAKNDSVTVCVPFTTKFIECIKWILDKDEYFIDTDGSLIFKSYDVVVGQHHPGEYHLKSDGSASVCVPDAQRPAVYYLDLIFLGECFVSAICLAIAIAIELVLPIKNQDCKPLVCHLFCLLLFYSSRVAVYFMKNPQEEICYCLSYVIRYTIRAAFSWITVINFEIWNQMRPANFLTAVKVNNRVYRWRKFIFQSLFAWSAPAIIIVLTYVLQYSRPLPNRRESCTLPLAKNQIQIIFFYSSTSLLQLINVVFFIMTVINLHRLSKVVVLVNAKIYVQLSKFYFKLMAITGIYWLLEIPVWATAHTISHAYTVTVDVITFLQGFFLLLLIYGCRKSVKGQLLEKFTQQKQLLRRKTKQSSSCTTLTTG